MPVSGRRPRWVYHWPRFRTAVCVCGETDERRLRFYLVGFRCEEHKP